MYPFPTCTVYIHESITILYNAHKCTNSHPVQCISMDQLPSFTMNLHEPIPILYSVYTCANYHPVQCRIHTCTHYHPVKCTYMYPLPPCTLIIQFMYPLPSSTVYIHHKQCMYGHYHSVQFAYIIHYRQLCVRYLHKL